MPERKIHTLDIGSLIVLDKEVIPDHLQALLQIKEIKLNISVYDSCANSESTILFIHGNSSSMKVFDSIIKRFSCSHRVIAIDLPGHGESFKLSSIHDLADSEKLEFANALYNPFGMVAVVKQIIDSLAIKSMHVIGWSLGGHLSYIFTKLYPSIVSSIVSIASPPVYFLFTHNTFRQGFADFFPNQVIPNWINNPKKFTLQDAYASARYSGYALDDHSNDDHFFINDAMGADPLMRKYLFKFSGWDNCLDLLDGDAFVRNTDIPVMLMVSKDDAAVKAEFIIQYRSRFKNRFSSVVIVSSERHATFLHKEFFAKKVLKFFVSIVPK